MLKTYDITPAVAYYDLTKKTIARIPTASNLKLTGSDNSLYYGMKDCYAAKVFERMFKVSNVMKISGKTYVLDNFGFKYNVTLNINAQGQIQIRFDDGNGTMKKIFSHYKASTTVKYTDDQLLLVCDFENLQVRVIPVASLVL